MGLVLAGKRLKVLRTTLRLCLRTFRRTTRLSCGVLAIWASTYSKDPKDKKANRNNSTRRFFILLNLWLDTALTPYRTEGLMQPLKFNCSPYRLPVLFCSSACSIISRILRWNLFSFLGFFLFSWIWAWILSSSRM